MENELTGSMIAEVIDKAIQSAPPQIQYQDIDKCTIYLPKLLINHLIGYVEIYQKLDLDNLKYRGYRIEKGYEMCVVIAHEDYPIYNKETLIHRLKLN